jgi:hypothetical protein
MPFQSGGTLFEDHTHPRGLILPADLDPALYRRITTLETTLAKVSTAAWPAYTPTLVNVTLGTGGTVTGFYAKVGRTTHFRIHIILGTGGVLTGTMTATLPVTAYAAAATEQMFIGTSRFFDADGGVYAGVVELNSTTTCRPRILDTTATWASTNFANATQPMTWAINDQMSLVGSYESAS